MRETNEIEEVRSKKQIWRRPYRTILRMCKNVTGSWLRANVIFFSSSSSSSVRLFLTISRRPPHKCQRILFSFVCLFLSVCRSRRCWDLQNLVRWMEHGNEWNWFADHILRIFRYLNAVQSFEWRERKSQQKKETNELNKHGLAFANFVGIHDDCVCVARVGNFREYLSCRCLNDSTLSWLPSSSSTKTSTTTFFDSAFSSNLHIYCSLSLFISDRNFFVFFLLFHRSTSVSFVSFSFSFISALLGWLFT